MCGELLKPGQVAAAGFFECPNCETKLQASNQYARWIALGSLLFSVVASLALGFRGFGLLYTVLLVFVVADFLALNLLKHAVPPKIEVAVPLKPIKQLVRDLKAPTELNLGDKKRP
jgi:hypothetical protein